MLGDNRRRGGQAAADRVPVSFSSMSTGLPCMHDHSWPQIRSHDSDSREIRVAPEVSERSYRIIGEVLY